MLQSEPAISGLRAGLQSLGYLEGKNYVLDIRLADDNASRYPVLVRELTGANVILFAAIGLTLRSYRVSAASDSEKAFAAIMRDAAEAMVVFNGVLPRPIQSRIVEFAAEHRVPAIYPDEEMVGGG